MYDKTGCAFQQEVFSTLPKPLIGRLHWKQWAEKHVSAHGCQSSPLIHSFLFAVILFGSSDMCKNAYREECTIWQARFLAFPHFGSRSNIRSPSWWSCHLFWINMLIWCLCVCLHAVCIQKAPTVCRKTSLVVESQLLWHHKGLIQERWDEERKLLRIVHRALLLLATHCRKYENGKTKEDTALCDVSKSTNTSLVLVFETTQPHQVSVSSTSKHGEGPTSAEESFTQ